MTTHLKRNTSIDLFNLLPLPDERNAMDSYLDMPNNFYILDGKNSRLLQLTKRREFNRKTIDGNEGFVLEIPFLEGVFGTKYFVVNKVTGSMMGIFDDKVEMVEAEAQLQPLNLQQLQHVVCTLEQKHQGFEVSSFADSEHHGNTQEMQGPTQDQRLQYPTTHKNFNTFDNLKSFRYKVSYAPWNKNAKGLMYLLLQILGIREMHKKCEAQPRDYSIPPHPRILIHLII